MNLERGGLERGLKRVLVVLSGLVLLASAWGNYVGEHVRTYRVIGARGEEILMPRTVPGRVDLSDIQREMVRQGHGDMLKDENNVVWDLQWCSKDPGGLRGLGAIQIICASEEPRSWSNFAKEILPAVLVVTLLWLAFYVLRWCVRGFSPRAAR